MRISYEVNRMDHYTIYCVEDETRTVYVQTDWDYPSFASSFGWNIASVPAKDGSACEHDATDGTVTCPCGLTATDFISAAIDYLDANVGKVVEDVGYFDAD